MSVKVMDPLVVRFEMLERIFMYSFVFVFKRWPSSVDTQELCFIYVVNVYYDTHLFVRHWHHSAVGQMHCQTTVAITCQLCHITPLQILYVSLRDTHIKPSAMTEAKDEQEAERRSSARVEAIYCGMTKHYHTGLPGESADKDRYVPFRKQFFWPSLASSMFPLALLVLLGQLGPLFTFQCPPLSSPDWLL